MTEKEDLEHLLYLLEAGNANMEWQSMMDKSTPNMSYQAWRHEPEVLSLAFNICFLLTSTSDRYRIVVVIMVP